MPENILPPGADTLLTISGFGQMYQAQARGMRQSLKVIDAAKKFKETTSGITTFVGNPIFFKYETVILCTDMNAPPLDNVWPGLVVTIQCALTLGYLNGNPGSPEQTVVAGSMWTIGGYTFYQPQMICIVLEPDPGEFDEYGCAYSWGLKARQIQRGQ